MDFKHISHKIEDIKQKFPNQKIGFNTGFKSLNNLLWGFQLKHLIVVGGRPSMGKSSVMGDMILGAAKETSIAVFSLEMPFELLQARLVCNYADVNFKKLQRGKATKDEQKDFETSLVKIKNLPIMINNDCKLLGTDSYWLNQRGIKLDETMDYKIQQAAKEGIKVVFVDYLQYITWVKPSNDLRVTTGQIVKTLRNYAVDYNICIVLLSQLRRFEQHRTKKPVPTMEDLKETGDIEQDSDVVILLHRPQYYKQKEIDLMLNYKETDAQFIIAKHRNGETGTIAVEWCGYKMSFRDLEQKNEF